MREAPDAATARSSPARFTDLPFQGGAEFRCDGMMPQAMAICRDWKWAQLCTRCEPNIHAVALTEFLFVMCLAVLACGNVREFLGAGPVSPLPRSPAVAPGRLGLTPPWTSCRQSPETPLGPNLYATFTPIRLITNGIFTGVRCIVRISYKKDLQCWTSFISAWDWAGSSCLH